MSDLDGLVENEENKEEEDRVEPGELQVYKRRWYILIMFGLLGFTQNAVWNTWGPLAASAEPAFGWTDADIALLANWGPITFIIGTPFFTWLMDTKGLRVSSLVNGALIFMATGLRCITSTPPAVTWLTHTGQILNGLAGPFLMGGPPLFSAVWFPVDQRTTATAISLNIMGLGIALSFVIGPLLVPVPERNSTWCPIGANSCDWLANNTNISEAAIMKTRGDIMRLNYIEFGFAALVCLIILIYFPAKPPKPPTFTASIKRVDFKVGFLKLLRNSRFWLLGIPYALGSGVYNCWSSMIDVNLKPLGVSQSTAGWIGFYGTLAGCGFSLLVARFADVFSRHMKMFILVLYALAVCVFTVLALQCAAVIPMYTALLYSTMIVGSMCVSGGIPLFYELVCESAYPIAEGVTNGCLTCLNNITGLLFLLALMIPNIGTVWMNWAVVGSIGLSIPVLMVLKEKYSRLDIDTSSNSPSNIQNEPATS